MEDAGHNQIHRLGRHGRALQGRAEVDVADLDDADGRVDAQVAGDAQRLVAAPIDDRVEQRIGAKTGLLHPPAQGGGAGEDRKSVGAGKSVSVMVDSGWSRIFKQKKKIYIN